MAKTKSATQTAWTERNASGWMARPSARSTASALLAPPTSNPRRSAGYGGMGCNAALSTCSPVNRPLANRPSRCRSPRPSPAAASGLTVNGSRTGPRRLLERRGRRQGHAPAALSGGGRRAVHDAFHRRRARRRTETAFRSGRRHAEADASGAAPQGRSPDRPRPDRRRGQRRQPQERRDARRPPAVRRSLRANRRLRPRRPPFHQEHRWRQRGRASRGPACA